MKRIYSCLFAIIVVFTASMNANAQYFEAPAKDYIEIDSVCYSCMNLLWPYAYNSNYALVEKNGTIERVDSGPNPTTYEVKIYSIKNNGTEPYLMWFRYNFRPLNTTVRHIRDYFFRERGFGPVLSLHSILFECGGFKETEAYIGGLTLIELKPEDTFNVVVLYDKSKPCDYRSKMVFIKKQTVTDYIKMDLDRIVGAFYKGNILVINNLCE